MTWKIKQNFIDGLVCSDCESDPSKKATVILLWHPPGMEADIADPPTKVPHVFPLCVEHFAVLRNAVLVGTGIKIAETGVGPEFYIGKDFDRAKLAALKTRVLAYIETHGGYPTDVAEALDEEVPWVFAAFEELRTEGRIEVADWDDAKPPESVRGLK